MVDHISRVIELGVINARILWFMGKKSKARHDPISRVNNISKTISW